MHMPRPRQHQNTVGHSALPRDLSFTSVNGSNEESLRASAKHSLAGKVAVEQGSEVMVQVSIRPGKDVLGCLQGFAAARDAGVHVLDGLQECAEGLV